MRSLLIVLLMASTTPRLAVAQDIRRVERGDTIRLSMVDYTTRIGIFDTAGAGQIRLRALRGLTLGAVPLSQVVAVSTPEGQILHTGARIKRGAAVGLLAGMALGALAVGVDYDDDAWMSSGSMPGDMIIGAGILGLIGAPIGALLGGISSTGTRWQSLPSYVLLEWGRR